MSKPRSYRVLVYQTSDPHTPVCEWTCEGLTTKLADLIYKVALEHGRDALVKVEEA